MIESLSVFFPAFNEGKNIKETVLLAKKVLIKVAKKWEVLVVDDGSKDNTADIVKNISEIEPRVKIVSHQRNLGYGGALQTGFYSTKYDWIVYNDSDGQFDFSEISRFIPVMDSADLLIGYRIKRKDSFYRLILAKGWSLLVFIFFGLRLKDVDCGFKMIRREVLKKIPKLESERGGMINAELAIKVKNAGFRIKQVGVTHYPRRAGRATGSQIRVIIKSFIELFKLWKKSKSF